MTADLATILQHQTDRLVELGYPALAGLTESELRQLVDPLSALDVVLTQHDDGPGAVSCVLVVSRTLVHPHHTVPLLRLAGGSKAGVVDRNHGDEGLDPYVPLDDLGVPDASVYLLVGAERGEEFCGVPPQDALPVIRERGRTPLTIEEGIALATHAPGVLEKNKCFMLSGSRRGDRRVPALWISERAPKLGWCWDGNPHSWLGVASAAARLAAP